MPRWLANFLKNNLVAPLALAGCLLFAVAAGVQTVRINGISFFGWYAVDGYKPMYEAAARDNATLKGNQAILQKGVKTCNASIDAARVWGLQHGAEVQAAVDAQNAREEAAQAEQSRLRAIKPGANSLVTALSVGMTGRPK
jgi:hypothetical protein